MVSFRGIKEAITGYRPGPRRNTQENQNQTEQREAADVTVDQEIEQATTEALNEQAVVDAMISQVPEDQQDRAREWLETPAGRAEVSKTIISRIKDRLPAGLTGGAAGTIAAATVKSLIRNGVRFGILGAGASVWSALAIGGIAGGIAGATVEGFREYRKRKFRYNPVEVMQQIQAEQDPVKRAAIVKNAETAYKDARFGGSTQDVAALGQELRAARSALDFTSMTPEERANLGTDGKKIKYILDQRREDKKKLSRAEKREAKNALKEVAFIKEKLEKLTKDDRKRVMKAVRKGAISGAAIGALGGAGHFLMFGGDKVADAASESIEHATASGDADALATMLEQKQELLGQYGDELRGIVEQSHDEYASTTYTEVIEKGENITTELRERATDLIGKLHGLSELSNGAVEDPAKDLTAEKVEWVVSHSLMPKGAPDLVQEGYKVSFSGNQLLEGIKEYDGLSDERKAEWAKYLAGRLSAGVREKMVDMSAAANPFQPSHILEYTQKFTEAMQVKEVGDVIISRLEAIAPEKLTGEVANSETVSQATAGVWRRIFTTVVTEAPFDYISSKRKNDWTKERATVRGQDADASEEGEDLEEDNEAPIMEQQEQDFAVESPDNAPPITTPVEAAVPILAAAVEADDADADLATPVPPVPAEPTEPVLVNIGEQKRQLIEQASSELAESLGIGRIVFDETAAALKLTSLDRLRNNLLQFLPTVPELMAHPELVNELIVSNSKDQRTNLAEGMLVIWRSSFDNEANKGILRKQIKDFIQKRESYATVQRFIEKYQKPLYILSAFWEYPQRDKALANTELLLDKIGPEGLSKLSEINLTENTNGLLPDALQNHGVRLRIPRAIANFNEAQVTGWAAQLRAELEPLPPQTPPQEEAQPGQSQEAEPVAQSADESADAQSVESQDIQTGPKVVFDETPKFSELTVNNEAIREKVQGVFDNLEPELQNRIEKVVLADQEDEGQLGFHNGVLIISALDTADQIEAYIREQMAGANEGVAADSKDKAPISEHEVSPEDSTRVISASKVRGTAYKGQELNGNKLEQMGLAPAYKAEVLGEEVYISKAFKKDSREVVIAYMPSGDDFIPRTYYRSLSGGPVWRFLPSYDVSRLGKGYGDITEVSAAAAKNSVTPSTQLMKHLSMAAREKIALSAADSELAFYGTSVPESQMFVEDEKLKTDYEREVAKGPWRVSGQIDDYKNNQKISPDQFRLAKNESPKFDQPIDSWTEEIDDDIYGKRTVEIDVFPSQDGSLNYMFMYDPTNKVAAIPVTEFPATKLTTTGIGPLWINAGDLNTSLIDHGPNKDGDAHWTKPYGVAKAGTTYVDMWPGYLQFVPQIQEYMKYKLGDEYTPPVMPQGEDEDEKTVIRGPRQSSVDDSSAKPTKELPKIETSPLNPEEADSVPAFVGAGNTVDGEKKVEVKPVRNVAESNLSEEDAFEIELFHETHMKPAFTNLKIAKDSVSEAIKFTVDDGAIMPRYRVAQRTGMKDVQFVKQLIENTTSLLNELDFDWKKFKFLKNKTIKLIPEDREFNSRNPYALLIRSGNKKNAVLEMTRQINRMK